MRRFAETTAVPIAKSRAEITQLLRDWEAEQIQWGDDFPAGQVLLRFVWPHDGARHSARFIMQLPTDAQLKERAKNRPGPYGVVLKTKLGKLYDARGRQEHRVLLLWLKAALNAVESGLVSAEAIFLPWLEGADGRTVAEIALPQMRSLLNVSASHLLPRGTP